MPQDITIEEILALNPHVHASDLKKALEYLRGLQNNGIARRGYTLPPPFSRTRMTIAGRDASTDPRTVSLRSRR